MKTRQYLFQYLPTTAWADDGDLLTAWDDKADAIEDGPIGMVAENDIIEPDLTTVEEDNISGVRCILRVGQVKKTVTDTDRITIWLKSQ